MKYVDFDGVIKDTHFALFEDYLSKKEKGEYISDVEHVINKDWITVLKKSLIIEDAIEILNDIKDVAVLTKIHSLENEGVAKIRDLRELGLKCDIILVPYQVKKTDVVNAKDNILVDDSLFNCDDWYQAGGMPIFFDTRGTNTDGWGVPNTKYKKTRTLDILKKY